MAFVMSKKTKVLILAAGKGTRMKSPLPKCLHKVNGIPMVFRLLKSLQKVSDRTGEALDIAVLVGFGKEHVISAYKEYKNLPQVTFLEQSIQGGTGHAVTSAISQPWGQISKENENETLLVLPGDQPLVSPDLLQAMLMPLTPRQHYRALTAIIDHPKGYGRVVRKRVGSLMQLSKVVEEKDATAAERKIKEVVFSTYLFKLGFLKTTLPLLSPKNAQNELYLTDVLEIGFKAKKYGDTLVWEDPSQLRGVNDPYELALAEKVARTQKIEELARQGVYFEDLDHALIDEQSEVEGGARIGTGVVISGHSVIKSGAHIKAHSVIVDSIVESDAQVGPSAHLRPESIVGKKAKIGNFVELKKTTIGENTSVAHLSYLGDATVGKNVNIGCGFVTCNYDGRIKNGKRKHETIIEDEAFIGSDCQVVAPIKIGRGAYIASGSTVTRDVLENDLAIARARQENKTGYALRLKPKS